MLLGAPHPGNFRTGVNHPRDGVEVDMAVLTGDALGHGHTLFFGFVGQHGATHHVPHRPHAGQVGFAVRVHHDGAAFIQGQTHGIGVQAGGVGHTANADDELVGI